MYPTSWAHPARLKATSLAVNATAHWIQAGSFGVGYKAMNGLSPQYLADDCQLTSSAGRRRLRSSNVATCEVLRTHACLSDRSFTVTCWTASVKQPTSTNTWHWNTFLLLLIIISIITKIYKAPFTGAQRRRTIPGVPPVTEDAPILLRREGPSDCFLCALHLHYITLHYNKQFHRKSLYNEIYRSYVWNI